MKPSDIISAGGVIAFRTDTFYGLGADPYNRRAVARIRELKGREHDKPILLLVSSQFYVDGLILNPPDAFERAAENFWPGPLTIIGAAFPNLPEEITGGTGTVGIRFPDDDRVTKLVFECGGVLTATSANPSGREPARSAQQVAEYFPSGLDLIVDDGEVLVTEPSTVLDVLTSPPRVIREGAIPGIVIEQLFA